MKQEISVTNEYSVSDVVCSFGENAAIIENGVPDENGGTQVVRNYKDSVFPMIFRDRTALLNLYNAHNETNYQEPEELEINTLRKVF